jgi:FKBP-type peptidyl-prolyl cis-trans isomerase FkpA
MLKIDLRRAASCLLTATLFVYVSAGNATEFETEEEKIFYALGVTMSQNLALYRMNDAELKAFRAGVDAGTSGKTIDFDVSTYAAKIGLIRQARLAETANKEKDRGREFLQKAAAEKGVVKNETGLLYKSLKEGKGKSPASTDMVTVHYEGKLIDGTVFDSSVKRGAPTEFVLTQVIPCWTAGLQMMKLGGKARLTCPSDIAYGDRGTPPTIPPGATLVFEVELLAIKKQE